MYKKIKKKKTSLVVNASTVGETMEAKMRRIINNKEPITDGAPIMYTERKDGVLPETNIRTDRFDVAIDAMDKAAKQRVAKREERLKVVKGGAEAEGGPAEKGAAGAAGAAGAEGQA